MRMHVDEVESGHVIGAILQITQDPDIAENNSWALEVIDYTGQRQQIAMKPGQMLLFESSRLVHGRPSVLQGKYYVNSFFYYRPPSGWKVYPKGNLRGVPMAEYTEGYTVTNMGTTEQNNNDRTQKTLPHADEL